MLKRLFGHNRAETPTEPTVTSSTVSSVSPQYTNAQLLLLSKFLEPQDADHYRNSPNMQGWHDVLNEWPESTLKRFIDSSHLSKSDEPCTVIACYTVAQLKAEMKQTGLKQSGTKRELVERLQQSLPARITQLSQGRVAYQCTSDGVALVTPFVEKQAQEREQAEAESWAAVRAGDLKRAAQIVGEFERRQVFKRGMGVDWDKYPTDAYMRRLEVLATSEKRSSDEKTALLMMELWGVGIDEALRKWMPSNPTSGPSESRHSGAIPSFTYLPFVFARTSEEELNQPLKSPREMFLDYPIGLRARLMQELAIKVFELGDKLSLSKIASYGEEADRLNNVLFERNMDGAAFEKSGKLDKAVREYTSNVRDGFEGGYPYERLRIIYTRARQYDDAIRVCQAVLDWNTIWERMGWKPWEKLGEYRDWIEKLEQKKEKLK